MRLDKFLANSNYGTRKHCKKLVKSGLVTLNGVKAKVPDLDFDPNTTEVLVDGKKVEYFENVYIVLNKPKDYISSLIDEEGYLSVLNLIDPIYAKRVRIVGRLDVDTTGLILLTDNGKLNNRLAHPHREIEKEYIVRVNHDIPLDIVDKVKEPIDIGKGEIAQPCVIKDIDKDTCHIILKEGKYHEVKRIFKHFRLEVIELKRQRIAFLELGDLEEGKFRLLNEEEVEKLKELTDLVSEED